MAGKRPREDGQDGTDSSSKRPRSNEPSPAPTNGTTAGSKSIEDQIAAAKARAAAVKARIAGGANPPPTSSAAPPAQAGQSPAEAARAKIEAMKARVAAATAKSSAATPPAAQQQQRTTSPFQPTQDQDDSARSRGGLGIGLHPALLNDSNHISRSKNKGPINSRFSTTMGNRRQESPSSAQVSQVKPSRQLDLTAPSLDELKQNPYFDPNVSGGTAAPRNRKSRELLFHQKGKFIAQAAALRRQARLEDMKRRIAESARKAGLDDDQSEQAFIVPEPPTLEWWDEGLVDGDSYPNFDDDAMEAQKLVKIDTEDSVITRYIQHPVLLDPPQDKTMPALKPMFMTKEEQAKKRRQNRTEVRKEKQARVRLGLEPPEPPKVKLMNMMNVLGEEAVKDPTAVEARVMREIAQRKAKHEQTNDDRKLTKEERNVKLANNQEKDAAKGILVNVYKIDSLANGKNRYKLDINAKQRALTGITIMNPRFNLVIVEGGQYSINHYKKLMLQRIQWTENAPLTESAQESMQQYHKAIAESSFLQPEDDNGQLKDLAENRCQLIWQGEEKQRAFNKWGSRVCATDAEARRILEKSKMENMWQLAKNWTG